MTASSGTIHLVKLCVGAETVDNLEQWTQSRARANEQAGIGFVHHHITRVRPRRIDELVNNGSIFWVIKGVVLARHRIVGFEKRIGEDEIERTAIMMEPKLILTEAQPRRAFQGWRYLRSEDAPKDLGKRSRKAPPPELSIKLAQLGLL